MSGEFIVVARKRTVSWRTMSSIAILTLAACALVPVFLHEPVPRVHDEFSYTVMADMFAHLHVAEPAPPLPESFDTFHVLMRPVYASKYFPAQGIFLAIGEKLTGHPAVGVWLSSALACAAAVWMLQAWTSPSWALLGGILMALQYGIFSYWSQSYWGGMAAALGGALFFGAFRRLWDAFSWQNSLLLALGLVILANSRPLEGVLAALPATVLFARRIWGNRICNEIGFWPKLVVPSFAVLAFGALAMGAYNRAITGSAFKPPYMLHEQQYQESPQFIFLPKRPKLTYTSAVVRYYYEVQEARLWASMRIPRLWISSVARRLGTWWLFYCGFFLSVPLVLPAILHGGKLRWMQIGLIAALSILAIQSGPKEFAVRGLIDLLAVLQIVLLWFVFDDRWSRLAIGTVSLLLLEGFVVKWAFPHYSAPAACLVLFLQVEGLRRVWNWSPRAVSDTATLSRSERRRLERESKTRRPAISNLHWIVYLVPVACFLSLCWHVEARRLGWNEDPHSPERQALLMNDWSLRRADLEHWLEQQALPQLVFVRYWEHHNVNFEWVYNHADIMGSHVIWARDLGGEHNKLLLNLVPDRTVWLLEADAPNPQLVSYSDAVGPAPVSVSHSPVERVTEQEQLDW
jgi:hypothetical protein